MTTYRLPDELGGREVEVLHGFARPDDRVDVRVPGVVGVITLDSASVLVVVPPPMPPEPPLNSFVHLASYYGVYERADHGWIAASEAGGRSLEWEALVRLNSGDTPVLLVPAPEPVTLPWKNHGVEVQQTSTDIGPGDRVHVSTKAASYGYAHLNPSMAREMAYALLTAADEADRRVPDATP